MDADRRAAAGCILADDDIEIGKPGRVDRGLGGPGVLNRIVAALGQEERDLLPVPQDPDLAPPGHIVGAGHVADAEQLEVIAGERDRIPRPHHLFPLSLPVAGPHRARHQHGYTEMGDAHRPGRARQADGAAHALAGRNAEEPHARGQLRQHARDHPAGERHAEHRAPRPAAARRDRRRHGDGGDERDRKAREHGAGPGALPGHQRPYRHHQEERDHQRHEGRFEEGRADRDLLSGDGVEDQRIERANEDRGAADGQQQIVGQQRAFARERAERAAGPHPRRAPGVERERAADDDHQEHQDVDPARRVGGEAVHRGQHAGAHQEGAQQAERESENREQHGPALQAVPLLRHDGRVQQRGRHQPRHEGGVLDRIPEPVPAPAELVIGPPGTQRDTRRQRAPGEQRPRPDPARPGRVHPAFDQRRHGEGERRREPDIAEIEQRRVECEAGILQQRVEIAPVERRGVEPEEGVGGGDNEDQKAETDQGLHGQHPGPEHRRQVAPEGRHGGAVDRENPDPEQHRAFVIAPCAGELVEQRLGRVGVVGDRHDREVGDDEGLHQAGQRGRDEGELRHRSRPGQRHQGAVAEPCAERRRCGLHERHGQREDQGVMADLRDHSVPSPFQLPDFLSASATSRGM